MQGGLLAALSHKNNELEQYREKNMSSIKRLAIIQINEYNDEEN